MHIRAARGWNRNGLGVGPGDRGRGRQLTRQDNPSVRRLASAALADAYADAATAHQQQQNRRHKHQNSTTSDTGSRLTVRCGNVEAVHCGPISACPTELSKAKQRDSEPKSIQSSQSSQSSHPVVRSPSPSPTANPPESGCWAVYRIIPPSLSLLVQILPPLPLLPPLLLLKASSIDKS